MFTEKKKSLFAAPVGAKTTTSPFVAAGLQKSAETRSGNGALKYATTGNPFIDQFGSVGTYRTPRTFAEIERDCELLWAQNPEMAIKFMLFIRLISRVVVKNDGTKTEISQKGAEMKHEGIMRFIWLHSKSPAAFIKNMALIPAVGSWKDIFTMLQYDLIHHGWEGRVLPWNNLKSLIEWGLSEPSQVELVKKYLPRISPKSKCKTVEKQANTLIGYWLASSLIRKPADAKDRAIVSRQYAQLKASGTAHQWQQLISRGNFNAIEFDKIHGRALRILVNSKFLDNNGLRAKYEEWITDPETKDVKFTGFVHELFESIDNGYNTRPLSSIPAHVQVTINKQFDTLVQKCKDEELFTNLIVVRDTSSSMGSPASGLKMSSFGVAKALALYFSEFLKGPFADSWIEFHSKATLRQWKGETAIEKWCNDRSSYVGSTNFQSVIDLLCQIKKQGVDESDFPRGILCISDGEFNPAQLGQTNVEAARSKLAGAGFSAEYVRDFVIVLWNIPNRYYARDQKPKFETFGNVPNVYYMSGYSGSIVSFLNGKLETTEDLFNAAMDQEILNLAQV